MSYSFTQMKKKTSKNAEAFHSGKKESSPPNSAMVENMGHRVDMPTVMREKMEDSFGMDLSGVKLYENKAVGKAGAEAVAQGSNIAFAPGKLDFSSTHGQELLGHEISHVASQAKGEVKGSGLVNDSALEARADREGARATRGESVTSGFGGAATPLSSSSAASAAGPMQAKSGKKKKKTTMEQEKQEMRAKARADFESAQLNSSNKETDDDIFDAEMDAEETHGKVDKMFQLSAAKMRQDQEYNRAFEKRKEIAKKYTMSHILEKVNQNAEKQTNKVDQAWKDREADRLLNEYAGEGVNKEDYRYLSNEDENWLENMFANPTLNVSREINRRQNQVGEWMYEHRQKLGAERPDEDQGKLDLETTYSPFGTNYSVYDYMRRQSRNQEIDEQLEKEDTQNNTEQQREKQQKAHNISVSGANAETNKYIQTDEGSEQKTRLFEEHIKRLARLSNTYKG